MLARQSISAIRLQTTFQPTPNTSCASKFRSETTEAVSQKMSQTITAKQLNVVSLMHNEVIPVLKFNKKNSRFSYEIIEQFNHRQLLLSHFVCLHM